MSTVNANVKTLVTPLPAFGTSLDTLVVGPAYTVLPPNKVRIAAVVTNNANVVNGVTKAQPGPQGQQANGLAAQLTVTVEAFDNATVYAAAIAESGYAVNA